MSQDCTENAIRRWRRMNRISSRAVRRERFHKGLMHRYRNYPRELKSGRGQQSRVLIGGSLDAAGHGEHQQIHQLAVMRRVPFGQDRLEYENAPLRRNRLAAVAQDFDRLFVRPVVKHVSQDIDIVAVRHLFEEIARDQAASLRQPARINEALACDTVSGRSNRTPRRCSFALSTVASNFPVPPPTSTTLVMAEKSYAAVIASPSGP